MAVNHIIAPNYWLLTKSFPCSSSGQFRRADLGGKTPEKEIKIWLINVRNIQHIIINKY